MALWRLGKGDKFIGKYVLLDDTGVVSDSKDPAYAEAEEMETADD
jgi:hypothetical protein